jgi:hypothetical protein
VSRLSLEINGEVYGLLTVRYYSDHILKLRSLRPSTTRNTYHSTYRVWLRVYLPSDVGENTAISKYCLQNTAFVAVLVWWQGSYVRTNRRNPEGAILCIKSNTLFVLYPRTCSSVLSYPILRKEDLRV